MKKKTPLITIALLVLILPLLSLVTIMVINLNPSTRPTPTKVVPSPTPPATPPPSTSSANIAPVITTDSLPSAYIGYSYNASIVAIDGNNSDQLKMTISGLPKGLQQGPCGTPSGGGKITCYIFGTPTYVGSYTIIVDVTDTKGSSASKKYTLSVRRSAPTPL